MMELVWKGHPITEDEYLENALKLIPGIRAWPGWWKVQQKVESTQPCHSALDINLYLDQIEAHVSGDMCMTDGYRFCCYSFWNNSRDQS